MNDKIILPDPAPVPLYPIEPIRIPLTPAIFHEYSYATQPADNCMFDAIMRANPGKTLVLGLVCPCRKCSPWCVSG